MLGLAPAVSAETACDVPPVDLLVIGDSQTGAFWGSSYYGNFLQKCLSDDFKNKPKPRGSFAIYGRGGTQPSHWLSNGGLDKISTIQRDAENNHKNIGANDQVPLCKRRLKPMLEAHRPRRVLAFFGDNLLTASDAAIKGQFEMLIKTIKDYGIGAQDCFIMTPTYEMEIMKKRNVAYKNSANTLKVTNAIKDAVGNKCRLINGLELMKGSPLLNSTLLRRIQSDGMAGCLGDAGNDNIHVCGEAARDLADRVCGILE